MAGRQSSLWAAFGVCIVAAAIGWVVQTQKMQSIEVSRKNVYQDKAVSLGVAIEKHLVEVIEISMAIGAVIQQAQSISPDQYETLARDLRRDRRHILNIAYAPDLVVEYVHPLEGNETVLGFDIRTRPDQWSAAKIAAEEGLPVIAGPVALVQGGYGFIVRLPVFEDNGTGLANLTGLISAVISIEPVANLVAETSQEHAFVAIRGRDGLGENGGLILGPPHVFEHDPVLYDLQLPFGHWQVGIHLDRPWNQLSASTLINIWGAVIAMCICGTAILITALRFQDKKERAESDLAAAIDSIEDGFAMFDPEDRLIMCNARYADLYDLPTQLQTTGTPFEDILKYGLDRGQYPEARGREREWLSERLYLHRNPSGSFNQLLTDGRWVKVAESKTEEGSIVAFRVDITDLKNAQEAAEKASKIKSQFLNNINHEMRTPLTVMLGYTPILNDIRRLRSFQGLIEELSATDPGLAVTESLECVVKEVSELSTKVQNSGRHLLNLVNDTLDLAKIEAREMQVELRPVALAPMIECLRKEFSIKTQNKNLEIKASGTNYIVQADELRLRQILVNLIGNAIKFTDCGLISIYTKERENGLEIIVSDTGCGISAQNLSKIFDEFHQGDASTPRNFEGTGLGLAISRNLAELQGGQLKVESVEGMGSRFSITLPFAEDCHSSANVTRSENSASVADTAPEYTANGPAA